MEKKVMSSQYKIGIVVILVVVVVVVIMLKIGRTNKQTDKETIVAESVGIEQIPVDSVSRESVKTEVKLVESKSSLPADVLATVNGEQVKLAAFNEEFNALPSQMKEYFKDDKMGFLDEVVLKRLLVQEAKRKKITEESEYRTAVAQKPEQGEQILINVLLRGLIANTSVNESELLDFFNQYKDQLPVKDYEAVKEQLRPMALEEKQRLVIEDYINTLKANAKIVRNDEWVKTQEALVADNPLSRAMKTKRPVVADFGRGTCIPCKMMQPILEKLQKDYAGKAEILILDIGEYASLSRKYRVMVIPTQIFFDANGKEVLRHQGFMPEADIVSQLRKMGAG